MHVSDAIGIAEGFIECKDEDELNEAWQLLIDTGICWELQGWFGRNAARLIESGICRKPGETKNVDPDYCDCCECTPCDCNWGTDE